MTDVTQKPIVLNVADMLYYFSEAMLFTAKSGDDLYIVLKNEADGPEDYIIAPVTDAEVAAVRGNTLPVRTLFDGRDLRYGEWDQQMVYMAPAVAEVPADRLPTAGVLLAYQEETAAPVGAPARNFIIADEASTCWGHIFTEEDCEIERDCRFVYDIAAEKIVHLEIMVAHGWSDADAAETADVEDSLKNANEEAVKYPERWGLAVLDVLPDWARSEPSLNM